MMSEKRFILDSDFVKVTSQVVWDNQEEKGLTLMKLVNLLNEQQELIEELHISDHMGWGRAEKFEQELKHKKIYITRLEDKVQKFKEMNSEQQDTIRKLRNENIISKNKIEDLRVSLFMQDQVLQRQMQKSDLDE